MNLIEVTIDGRPVQVQPGQTLLHAAAQLGIEIPTVCFLDRCGPLTSCLVCLVKCQVNGQARLVPSCATKAQPGMIVESETPEVHEARRTALELLLSDHVGDCLSPCHRICPLHLNIPQMLRQVESGQLQDAVHTVRTALPLPAVLGRLCHHPCEGGCRRGNWDEPAAIREVERHVADAGLEMADPFVPPRKALSGKSVAIIGAGPAGLAAADRLLQQGHACTVVDRNPKAGGSLRTQVSEEGLPAEVLDKELAGLERLGLQYKLGVEFGTVVTLDGLQRGFDAILLTVSELARGEGASFGVTLTAAGIKVDARTYQASVPGVFAAGSAIKQVKHLVRAMAEGRAAAECVDAFLSGAAIVRRDKVFSSVMGRLERPEVEAFASHALAGPRQQPHCGGCAGFNTDQAQTESGRCMHCDCRAEGNCALQRYASQYGADPGRFRDKRRPFEQYVQHGGVIYEPGKCILCGICVRLAEQAAEPLGLAFVGRGFDVRITTPFNRTIEEGLQKVAADCVEHCPTGALVFRETRERTSATGPAHAHGAAHQRVGGTQPPID
jgi:ferredoxin